MPRPQTDTRYCRQPRCKRFNEPQGFLYYPTSYEAPGEWIDEPECRSCGHTCGEHELDVQYAVEGLSDALMDDLKDVDAGALVQYVLEVIQRMRHEKPVLA
jgi:hypothetical protein